MTEPGYEVVWPLGRLKSVVDTASGESHISDLNGKTICEIWDGVFRGEEIFPEIREALHKRYPDIKFVEYIKFGNIHASNEAKVLNDLPDLLRRHKCDAVISGVGA